MNLDFKEINKRALDIVYEQGTGGFIVINGKNKIIDFNNSFIKILTTKYKIRANMDIEEYLNNFGHFRTKTFLKILNNSIKNNKGIEFEYHLKKDHIDKYLHIEVVPKILKNKDSMTVIVVKDISEIKKSYLEIKDQRKKILDREKMASIGELISGIPKSLSKPLYYMYEDIKDLECIINKYDECITNNKSDIKCNYINLNMNREIEKLNKRLSLISSSLNKLKEQTVKSIRQTE